MGKLNITAEVENAYQEAIKVRANAYAPYSKFQVGAAIKFSASDKLFLGVNVENASYGACICAERNAIVNSVATLGKSEIEFIVVVTNQDKPAPPCALCLQVISEFYRPDMPIYLGNLSGIQKMYTLKELLPVAFTEFEGLD